MVRDPCSNKKIRIFTIFHVPDPKLLIPPPPQAHRLASFDIIFAWGAINKVMLPQKHDFDHKSILKMADRTSHETKAYISAKPHTGSYLQPQ